MKYRICAFLLLLSASPAIALPIQYSGTGDLALNYLNPPPIDQQVATFGVGTGDITASLDPATGQFIFHATLTAVNSVGGSTLSSFPIWMTQPVTLDLTANFPEQYLFPAPGFLSLNSDGQYAFDMRAGEQGSSLTVRDYQGNVLLHITNEFTGDCHFGFDPNFSTVGFGGIDYGAGYQGKDLELIDEGFTLTAVPEPPSFILLLGSLCAYLTVVRSGFWVRYLKPTNWSEV